MLFRHWRRCKMWSRPAQRADIMNSLHDAAVDTPPGMMLVYEIGEFGHNANDPVMNAARGVADRLGMALVQWPTHPIDHPERQVAYALQRRGRLSA